MNKQCPAIGWEKASRPGFRLALELKAKVCALIVALLMALSSGTVVAGWFEPVLVAEHREITAVEVGPDGHLYALSIARRSLEERSRLTRYHLDADGEPTGRVDLLHVWTHRGERENDGDRPIGLAFDPRAPADNLVLWITINRDPTTDLWGGRVVVAHIPSVGEDAPVLLEERIINLPVGFHEVNQLTFAPDGRLFICVGSTTTLGAPDGRLAGGGGTEFPETPLSAAILEVDVSAIDGTLDVRTGDGGSYDPFAPEAPVRPYATGIRQVYDVAWHNGRLYGAVNQNDVQGRTGSCGGVPDLKNQTPPEFLAIFQRGRTYGHPNPSRGQCTLMGGRPTENSHEWYHIQAYPVGVAPHEGFDSSLLHPIGDRYGSPEWDIGGGSANGIISYQAPGPHQGRLMQAFYGGEGAGRIWAFLPGPDGRIIQQYPLRDREGKEIRLFNCLDLAQHPTGRIYVARYGNQGDPVDGDLWMLRPASIVNERSVDGRPDGAVRLFGRGDQAVAGRPLYTITCAACHQADGSGLPGQFPPLDQSPWVRLADPEPLLGIILHGKWDGAAIMPPHAWMDDGAVASIVNFVRQEWGLPEAGRIDPGKVQDFRGRNKDRRRPWTNPELETLMEAGRQ